MSNFERELRDAVISVVWHEDKAVLFGWVATIEAASHDVVGQGATPAAALAAATRALRARFKAPRTMAEELGL